MRSLLFGVLLAASTTASADTPKSPNLVVTWAEGEMSRDMSIWRTTITVTGSKLHYSRQYSGRDHGMPHTQPVELDASVKDWKRVTDALEALDKIKLRSTAARDGSYHLREGCVIRDQVKRCASVRDDARTPADLDAIARVRDAVLYGVNLP